LLKNKRATACNTATSRLKIGSKEFIAYRNDRLPSLSTTCYQTQN